MAQLSGATETEKLQKIRVGENGLQILELLGQAVEFAQTSRIFAHVAQYNRSAMARNSSDSRPRLNICRTCSRGVSAS